MSAKIRQGMEKNGELMEALNAIKNVAKNNSWFRGTPHRWASASLPLAYAVRVLKSCLKVRRRLGYCTIGLSKHGVTPD